MNMLKQKHQNTTNYVDLSTNSNGWTLLTTLIKFLCVLSLVVLVGYIYINLSNQNQRMQLQLMEIEKQLGDNNYIKQNLDNDLLQCAQKISKNDKLNEFGLVELDKTQIVVLNAPNYDIYYFLETPPKKKQKFAQYQSTSESVH